MMFSSALTDKERTEYKNRNGLTWSYEDDRIFCKLEIQVIKPFRPFSRHIVVKGKKRNVKTLATQSPEKMLVL